jgi:pimeloyl-ACP methyl ester carboxylesterase
VRRALRWLRNGLLTLVIFIVAAAAISAFVYRDLPRARVEAFYAKPPSQFITVDGVRMHVRDEGPRDAPAILLIHGHYGSLFMWDGWIETLTKRYRVVRFDYPSHGLTGPDPTGDYSLGRSLALIEGLVKQLNLSRFHIVGTSLGGQFAFHYAARHPDKVDRMILISPGGLVREGRDPMVPQGRPFLLDVVTWIAPHVLYNRLLLEGNFVDKSKVTKELREQYIELNILEGQRPAELERVSQYRAENADEALAAVRAPTLVQWGGGNRQLGADQADQFLQRLSGTRAEKIIYPEVGHMPALEAPQATVTDAVRFLDRVEP